MKPFYYKYLDFLPPLPNDIQEKVRSGKDFTEKINQSTDRTLTSQQKQYQNGYLERWRMDTDTFQWIKDNITDRFIDISAQIMIGDRQGPHTDRLRLFHLYWICDLGDPKACTVWYQANGKNQRLDEFVVYENYDELNEVFRDTLQANRWILFDSRIIHAVEGCGQGTRKGLTVDLESVPDWIIDQANLVSE